MPEEIDRDRVKELLDKGAQLVEVLAPKEYARVHIPGAVNIPLPRIDERAPNELDKNRPVIVYCYDAL